MATLMDAPVITIIRVIPNAGRKADVIEWFEKISTAASQFNGYVKSEVFETCNPVEPRELLNIFIFDSYSHLTNWEASPHREEILSLGRLLFKQPEAKRLLTGMEFLFHEHKAETAIAPLKWKIV